MKITEILKELDQQAPDILPQVAQDYQKGVKAVSKVLDPKQWFGGKSSPETEKAASAVEMRDSLNAAAAGKVYMDDINILKQALSGIQAGTYKVSDPTFTIQSLKTVIANKQLSKEQATDLKNFAASF